MNTTTNEAIALAAMHAPSARMRSSADLCLSDARSLASDGDDNGARMAALRSLSYSVGICHADYQRVKAMVRS